MATVTMSRATLAAAPAGRVGLRPRRTAAPLLAARPGLRRAAGRTARLAALAAVKIDFDTKVRPRRTATASTPEYRPFAQATTALDSASLAGAAAVAAIPCTA